MPRISKLRGFTGKRGRLSRRPVRLKKGKDICIKKTA